jgi:hypothetical protein
MPRPVRLYITAQLEEVRTPVDRVTERSDLPLAERDRLSAFRTEPAQTVREDRRRADGNRAFPWRRAGVA